MCYSFKISVITGLTSWIIGMFVLFSTKNIQMKKDVIRLLIFSSIQFTDAVLWFIDMKKNTLNLVITRFFIPFILSLQLLYGNYFYFAQVSKLKLLLVWLFIIYLFFFKFDNYTTKSQNCKKQTCSPVWGGREIHMIEMIIFFLLAYFNGLNDFAITSLPVILFIYWYFDHAYGSHWCAISNLSAFYYLICY